MAATVKMVAKLGHCRIQAMAVLLAVEAILMSGISAANAQAYSPSGEVLPNEGNPCGIGWYRAHGWLMWLAFGIFFPLGVLVSRYGQYHISQWFWTHISLQVVGVILSTIAFAIATNEFGIGTVLNNTHIKLGIAIMILIWMQTLLSFVRPARGSSGIRPAWYIAHWLTGTTAIILGWFNIFKGLDEYVANWPIGGERKASYVLWGVHVAILAFLYLFLERLPYIRAQECKDLGAHDTPSDHKADDTPFDDPKAVRFPESRQPRV